MERIYEIIADLLPRRVLYYAVIRVCAIATTQKYMDKTPYEINWSDAIKAL